MLVFSCDIWIALGYWILKHGHRPLLDTSGKIDVTHARWIQSTCHTTLAFLPRQIVIGQNQILLWFWLLDHWRIIVKLIFLFQIIPVTLPLLSRSFAILFPIINVLHHSLLIYQILIWLLLLINQPIHTILLVWQFPIDTRLHQMKMNWSLILRTRRDQNVVTGCRHFFHAICQGRVWVGTRGQPAGSAIYETFLMILMVNYLSRILFKLMWLVQLLLGVVDRTRLAWYYALAHTVFQRSRLDRSDRCKLRSCTSCELLGWLICIIWTWNRWRCML